MNLRAFSLTLVLAFVLLTSFATLNWVAIAAPSTLGLGFVAVSAPLGMVMLIFTAAISGLFIVYMLLQAGVIVEAPRLTKEVKAQRELPDTAESSRFRELRTLVDCQLRRIEVQDAASSLVFATRIEQSGQGMQGRLTEATAAPSAHLGEIENKLDRSFAPKHAFGMASQAER